MRDDTLRFDILHNFISPVTGRILCTTDYVLVGNAEGVAEPSNIFGPIIPLFPLIESLSTTDFVIGHTNPYLPEAQVLEILDDGIMINTGGTVSTETEISISNLPDLAFLYIWQGNAGGRPAPYLYVNPAFPLIIGIPAMLDVLGAASIAHTNEINMINVALENAPVNNQILLGVNGTNNYPVWSSATYPSTVNKNDIIYAPANNVISGLASIPNSVLTTDALGVPSWTTPSAGGVTSVSGTINQITASPTTGAIVLSLPTDVDVAGSINTGVVTAGFIQIAGSTLLTINTNGDLTINPNGSGNIIMVSGTSTGLVGIGTNAPLYSLDVNGTTRVTRLLGNANIPTVSLGSTSIVGSGATNSIVGSEVGGIFTLTTGSSGISAIGIVATFTLTNAMPSSTFSIVMSSGATGTPAFFALSTSSTTFTLSVDSSLNINTTYIWNYHIVG